MKKYLSKGNIICGIITIILLLMTFSTFEGASNSMPLIQEAVTASSDKVIPENDGKIVIISGRIAGEGYSAVDDTFDIEVDTPLLKRKVEVYQWVKKQGAHSQRKDDEYYEREWSDANPILYGSNPWEKPYENKTFYSTVKLGSYEISTDLVSKLEPLGERVTVEGLSSRTAEKFGMVLADDFYYIYQDLDVDYVEVGDARISYSALDISDLREITILAKQEGNMLVADVFPIGNIYAGILGIDEVTSKAAEDVAYAKWTALILTFIFALITAYITWNNSRRS